MKMLSPSRAWLFARLLALALALGLGLGGACKRSPAEPQAAANKPTLRIFVVTSLAGALEPCGCVKDMLGGIDHAAKLAASRRETADSTLLVAAGPTLFIDPTLRPTGKTQDLWKADAIAESLRDMGLAAWSPGANDWAGGADKLKELREKSGAALLAGNLSGAVADAQPTRVIEVKGAKVGIAGVSLPLQSGLAPEGVEFKEARPALEAAKQALESEGAKIKIALVSAPRGEALRLAELVPGFQLMVVGKPVDRGEQNDGPTAPVLLGETLVVQTPNHLQAVAVVDLVVRGGDFRFQDGSGIANSERKETLQRRIEDLEKRIGEAEKPGSGVKPEDVAARRADLTNAKQEFEKIGSSKPPAKASFFRYELVQVKEGLGSEQAVSGRMQGYYKRVNEHNKTEFADRKPQPVAAGQSGYLGIENCTICHAEERKFWDTTGHAKAYPTLTRQDKQFNLDCVDCHVTGYDKPGGSTVTHVDKLESVQCEVCHGPGSRHPDAPANPEFIVKKPQKSMCAPECHHPPHVKNDWSVDEAWKHIIGKGHGG